MSQAKKIVLKIEEGMDPRDVHCTTYQMRDVYSEVATAHLNALNITSLHMHYKAAQICKSGDKVLDVCCGRAMVLPLLRRIRPKILSYVGVDIWPANWSSAFRRSAVMNISEKRFAPNYPSEQGEEPFYPFPITFVEADVADMHKPLSDLKLSPFDMIIYMASIEHMQKTAGIQSVVECFRLLRPGGTMFLTTPNTEDKENEYDTQYAAHLYEWGRQEVRDTCESIGFVIEQEFGLLAKVRGYREAMEEEYPELVPIFDKFREYYPSTWLYSVFPVITPLIADEVAFIMSKPV